MHLPQLLFIGLIALSLGIELERDGEAKTGEYSFWLATASACITLGLLYWGGFFN